MRTKQTIGQMLVGAATAAVIVNCNSVIGLTEFSIDSTGQETNKPDAASQTVPDASDEPSAPKGECETNAQCTERATLAGAMVDRGDAGPSGTIPAVCLQPEGKCVELLSEDCSLVTGDYLSDNAIVIGSLFSVKGAQAPTNVPRQQSAIMAVRQINTAIVGGIPGPNGARPLVMVSCDEFTAPLRAATHLVNDLRVPAIVGPNTSQDTLELSQQLTVKAGTVLMTPTAVASSIADLIDSDLTWLMVPSDVQRAPLMIKQLNDMEGALNRDPARSAAPVKLAIVFRHDALGQGTRDSLNTLVWNGKPLADPTNSNGMVGNVRIEPYEIAATWTDANWTALVDRMVAFQPDIVVLAGTAEGYTKFIVPFETKWVTATKPTRPSYMLIDSNKVPELLKGDAKNAVFPGALDPDFRKRVRGTGVISVGNSKRVLDSFTQDYGDEWKQQLTASGMGPSYDATYAIAYALAATQNLPVSGASVAKGLRKLAGGATAIDVGKQLALRAFSTLSAGDSITGTGTFGPLEWDSHGAPVGGTLEMWCIGAGPTGGDAIAKSTGLTYDIKAQKYGPDPYMPCTPP